MTKKEFLELLQKSLKGLSQADIDERLNFYGEIIDDKVEDGLTEEQAVAELGDIDKIALQIIEQVPLAKIVKEKLRPKRKLAVWEIVLLVIGSPVWGALIISALAVIFSIYASLWALVVSAWAVFVSFAVCPIAGVIAGFVFIFTNSGATGVATIGASIVCIGLAVFTFFGCILATKGTATLTRLTVFWIKNLFIKVGAE